MNRAEGAVGIEPGLSGEARREISRLWMPALAALVVVTIILVIVVMLSPSAWVLLGAGRGLISKNYYPISGFVLVLATTIGQAVGWAGGSALGYYLLTRIGFRGTWTTWRVAMSIVYVGLAGLPLTAYHMLFGQPLLGMPSVGLKEWVARHHPDAAWLLFSGHPVVDLSLIPLGLIFLGLLWRTGERPGRSLTIQTVLAVALLGTSLAVALSLSIHSTLVHIHIMP